MMVPWYPSIAPVYTYLHSIDYVVLMITSQEKVESMATVEHKQTTRFAARMSHETHPPPPRECRPRAPAPPSAVPSQVLG